MGFFGIKMNFFKAGGSGNIDSSHGGAGLLMMLLAAVLLAGCGRRFPIHAERSEVSYEICSKEQLPGQLQTIIEKKKQKPSAFSFHDGGYTYLVVCYGEKEYGGYSVRVEECSRGSHILYMRTQLVGPAAGEKVIRKKSWPRLIVRCKKTGDLCLIEP